MQLRMKLLTEFLTDDEMTKIFDAAVRIWRRVPLRIQAPDELMQPLRDFGCEVDGELVRFPGQVIDMVIDRVRESKKAHHANEGEDGWPGNTISMYTHGQALLACDLETNELRPATKHDLEVWCHVVDSFGDVTRSHPTFLPTDVPNSAVDFNAFAIIMLNSRTANSVSVYNAKMLPYFIEASVVAQGSVEAVKKAPQFHTKMWVNSPFMITRENVDVALEARRLLGRPIQPATMPSAGAATPVTLAGALAQNCAEILALNAMTLAVDGRLCGKGVGPVVLDMQAAAMRTFGPDYLALRYADSIMASWLFGGKPGWPAMTPGAQVVSPQALHEKGLAAALSIAGGNRSLGIGQLGTADVGSLVQLELDYEMGCMFRHLLREAKVDADHIPENLIVETVPRGAYYPDTDHTARFFREASWLPKFEDFRIPGAWQENPSDMIERARDAARERVRNATNQCPLSEDQREEIERLVEAANKEAGDSMTR